MITIKLKRVSGEQLTDKVVRAFVTPFFASETSRCQAA